VVVTVDVSEGERRKKKGHHLPEYKAEEAVATEDPIG